MTDESGVRIVELRPMRVAAYRAAGKEPEIDAFKKMAAWAERLDLTEPEKPRLFGFDNPGPKPGEAKHGYEVWMTVGPDVKPSGEIAVKDIPGGRFAVKRTGLDEIGRSWKELVAWCKSSVHVESDGQCLEEHLTSPVGAAPENVIIDLYLPIE